MKRNFLILITLSCVLLTGIYGFSVLSLKKYDSKEPALSTEIKSVTVDVNNASVVYFTKDISPDGLMAVYEALGRKAEGKVAVKLHTGEPGGHHFLSPNLIKNLVQSVNGTIVECNTAYGGSRASTAMHRQVAIDHGFTAIANVDIMDADGYSALPVTGGKHLTQNYVGSHFSNYDFFIILSHFKGHQMGGFGGALKNMSIGIASTAGKCWIHSAGNSMTSPWGGAQVPFLESMAEAASSVANSLGNKILYISVMNNLSVDCDCNSRPAAPTMANIGILASLDPVALDQACVDLVYAAPDGANLIRRMESVGGITTVVHAAEIGLGSRAYDLVDMTATSVNDVQNKDVDIYPNPASSTIKIPNYEQYDHLYLFDTSGRNIAKLSSSPEVSISSLNQGRYFIQFIDNGKLIGTSSFIKK